MIPCFRHRDTEAVVTIRYQGHDVPACQPCVDDIRALRRPTPAHEIPMPTEPSPSKAEFDAILNPPDEPIRPASNARLPLVLRPRADAHPGCRIDDCPSTSDYSRHLCRTHHKQATKAGILEQLGAPANQGRVAAGRQGGETKAKNRETSAARASAAPDSARPDATQDTLEARDPAPPVTLTRDGTAYLWPSGRTAIQPSDHRVGVWLAWPDTADEAASDHYRSPEAAAEYLRARLPDPVCSKMELPDLDAPAAGDQMTARERELTARVEAQARTIRRLEAERERAQEADDAADALDEAGVPEGGTLAYRVRCLAARLASAEKAGRFLLTAAADDMVIDPALGAALVLLLEEAQKAGRAPSPGLVAAFRAALGVGDV